MKHFNFRTLIKAAALAAIALWSFSGMAQNNDALHISDIRIEPSDKAIQINMTVSPQDFKMSRNSRIRVTPVLRSCTSADSISLPYFEIAGTNLWYARMREGVQNDATLHRAGRGESFTYSASADIQEWMNQSKMLFHVENLGCCGAPRQEPKDTPVALIDLVPPVYNPTFMFDTEVATGPKTRKIEGKAFINFPVNRTEIYPEYMSNPRELRKILNSIDSVRTNSDITVKRIALKGFASPEGPYKNNVRLAAGRTQTLKEYVRGQFTFPASIFHTDSEPEDWDGLLEAVEAGSLPDREEIINFINDRSIPIERKNDELRKRFPTSYDWLLKNIYPSLRHTNYEIVYDIRVYTSVEEILEIMRIRPQDLSLNEIFTAALSFPKGSQEQNRIFETAALLYPAEPKANLNAASVAMIEGNLPKAESLLMKAGNTPQAIFARATLAALNNDYDTALSLFNMAKNAGIAEANRAIEEITTINNHTFGVTFIK